MIAARNPLSLLADPGVLLVLEGTDLSVGEEMQNQEFVPRSSRLDR